MYLVIILFALFASLFTLQKEALKYSEQFFLTGSRMLIAGIFLLMYKIIKNKNIINISIKKNIKIIFILAFFNIYLTNTFEIWGLNHMLSSKACLIYSLSPFIAAILDFKISKKNLSKKKILGIIIGFTGLMPIIYTQTIDEIITGKIFVFSNAEISLIIAVICSVYGWILLKKIVKKGFSIILINGICMIIGGIFIILQSYISGEIWAPFPIIKTKKFIIYVIIMCVISNIICYNLFGMLLKKFTVTFMTFAGLITPIFALIFGFIFLEEKISGIFIISIILFTIGLVIFYQEEIKKDDLIFKTNKKNTLKKINNKKE